MKKWLVLGLAWALVIILGGNCPVWAVSGLEWYYRGKDYARKQDYQEACKCYLEGAKLGYAEAQFLLACAYSNGQGVERNDAEAAKWWRKAAEQRINLAAYALALCYWDGVGVQKDVNEAFQWFLQAAEQGVAEAQFRVGCCYDKGEGVSPDEVQAARWYREAAVRGHQEARKIWAQREQADQPDQQGTASQQEPAGNVKPISRHGLLTIPPEVYTATSIYDSLTPDEACQQGMAACKKGDAKGYAMLESSARRGCNRARIAMAKAFLPSDLSAPGKTFTFVFADKPLASSERRARYLQWMGRAADNGSLPAIKAMRQAYKEGVIAPKNSAQVFKYTKMAALHNDRACMYDLGIRYSQGIGCRQDKPAAAAWMKKAANMGSQSAQNWLYDRRAHSYSSRTCRQVAGGAELLDLACADDLYSNGCRPILQAAAANGEALVLITGVYPQKEALRVTDADGTTCYLYMGGDLSIISGCAVADVVKVKVRRPEGSRKIYCRDLVHYWTRTIYTGTQSVRVGPKIGGWEGLL